MIYLFLTVLAALLVIEWRKCKSDAAAYEATIDDLRRESNRLFNESCQREAKLEAENEQLRARLAALEAPPDYLKGESE